MCSEEMRKLVDWIILVDDTLGCEGYWEYMMKIMRLYFQDIGKLVNFYVKLFVILRGSPFNQNCWTD